MPSSAALPQSGVMTFDVVGTLIDFERGILDHIRAATGKSAADLPDGAILDAYRKARGAHDAGLFPDDLVRVHAAMARDLNLPADPAIGEGLRDSAARWPAFPDSVEALARLKRRFRLVAMTNARRWAFTHFARTLGEPFADSVTVDEAGVEKPDPQFFAFTRGRLSTLGCTMADIFHVAQSQYHDIGVAKRLGYRTCWIERRKGKAGFGGTLAVAELTVPDHHFTTLGELADAIDAAAA